MKVILTITLVIGSLMSVGAQSSSTSEKHGVASYYHNKFEGRKTATGETFAQKGYTCASNRVSLGKYIKVTNLSNGRVIYVKVNDRMAANSSRLVDLTTEAARKLGFASSGTANVKIEQVSEEEGRSHVLAQRETGEEGKNNQL